MVTEAVLQLPAQYRRAIALRYWHDLPPRAIAKQLGIPIATVKTHLQRGLAELRNRLDHHTGDRRASLLALVPIAHPQLLSGVASASPLALTTTAALIIMNTKHLLLALIACLCLGVLAWQPWQPPSSPDGEPSTSGRIESERAELRDSAPQQPEKVTAIAQATATTESIRRESAATEERRCTVHGRIVTTGGVPASQAQLRLVNRWEQSDAPTATTKADADGHFQMTVPRPHKWLPYTFALAEAPGWAVHELELENDVQHTIANDQLDLGTIVLERGVAIAGFVTEADGTPLQTRARLLAWDPSSSGSWTAMHAGRTVGFAEPGGHFELANRMSAGEDAVRMLAAVSASGVGWASLEFAAGQQYLDPVTIRLLPGGSIDVQIVDTSGDAIADAELHATPHFKPIGLAPMWKPSNAGAQTPPLAEVAALLLRRTDQEGRAQFHNLPRGKHAAIRDANLHQPPAKAIILRAHKPGYVPNGVTIDPGLDRAAKVTITLTKQRRVAFHGVVAAADNKPISGVTVRLSSDSTVTDSFGRYEFKERAFPSAKAFFRIEGGDVPLTRSFADIPPTGDRIEHNLIVALRAPVSGRVVDQLGNAVAGVALLLGIKDGTYYKSTPKRTGEDGRFHFPDAVASQDHLWVRPPNPLTAWRLESFRTLSNRDDELVALHRLKGPLVDLNITVIDGRNGTLISPTEIELMRLHGNSRRNDMPHLPTELALGTATAKRLPPGRYRATVRAADDLRADQTFVVTAAAQVHSERIELWPATAVVCTVDPSQLPAAMLAANSRTALALLFPQSEQSYVVDAKGERMNYTPNTGGFRIGGELTFRLERITANVPLRIQVQDPDLFGEVRFRAEPGQDAHVTLHLTTPGKLAFRVPVDWPDGTIEVDVHDGHEWQFIDGWQHHQKTPERLLRRPAGAQRWRLRLWSSSNETVVERTGTTEVIVGATVVAPLE